MEILTQKTYMIGVNRNSFRAGEPAEIIEFNWVKPSPELEWRLAFKVLYFDDKIDYVAYDDVVAGNNVIISDVDLANERIPQIRK